MTVPSERKKIHRSLRRRSGVAYVGMLVSASFFLPTAANRNSVPLVDTLWSASVGVALISACVLLGPVARFVVTPQSLHVDTAFRRVTIPRHLLGKFTHYGPLIRADLTDGAHVKFRVDSPLWDTRTIWSRRNDRNQNRTTARITSMLEQVPADTADTSVVTRTLRPFTTAFGILIALTVIPLLIITTARILWQ